MVYPAQNIPELFLHLFLSLACLFLFLFASTLCVTFSSIRSFRFFINLENTKKQPGSSQMTGPLPEPSRISLFCCLLRFLLANIN